MQQEYADALGGCLVRHASFGYALKMPKALSPSFPVPNLLFFPLPCFKYASLTAVQVCLGWALSGTVSAPVFFNISIYRGTNSINSLPCRF